ncbi:MAG: DUF4115 domain-containing protein [Rhodovarius sp.]|nr:DUF4115 domain-containing protein [Rhodovarius sp.]MCX7931183.1 DUF4115 domain-containing protein [Rhodovarius sp.]MDW8313423.1 DUF4115 domain-containing protein [Rhodovarius sp.]
MSFSIKRHSRSDAGPSPDAARIGEELRDARIAAGLTIEDVSERLRIRRVYLLAIEEGRLRDLPSPTYALGFVRNYAAALGLDAADVARRFREAMGPSHTRRSDLVFPEPVPERGVPTGVLVLAGAVLVIGAYAAWYSWSGSGERLVDAVPPVPARLEQAARDGTPPHRPEPPPLPVPGLSAGAPPTAVPLPEPVPVPVVVPPPPPPAAPPPSPTDASRITFRFSRDTWVQVRPANQPQPIFDRTLRAGESYTPPNQPNLLITFGQTQGIEVTVDGQPVPGLAPGGPGVRRNIPLDPELFRAGPVPPGARFTPRETPTGQATPAPPQQPPAPRP